MSNVSPPAHSGHQTAMPRHVLSDTASRSASFEKRTRTDDSWVEVSLQPSSSSLSSVNDEVITTGLRVEHNPRTRRRRTARPDELSHLSISKRPSSIGATSSQEEYEESESESDRVMTSSGEGPVMSSPFYSNGPRPSMRPTAFSAESVPQVIEDEDDDENRTAINYPINGDACFTPQPNAFSHPPSRGRHASLPTPGSYFPSGRPRPAARPAYSSQPSSGRPSHMPQNILSPSYNAAMQHDEALRASLTTLLSCAAAARGLSKSSDEKNNRTNTSGAPAVRSNRVEPLSLRLVPESALPVNTSPPMFQEPTFKPTLRRTSTSTTATSSELKDHKRKANITVRSNSRERRAMKKVRHSTSAEDLHITPTLLTWVVSAGVVVVLSALSFSAGYSLGKEAGMLEAGTLSADEGLRTCAQEAGRTSLGLKRSLARSAVQV